jgi:hypothetical protein
MFRRNQMSFRPSSRDVLANARWLILALFVAWAQVSKHIPKITGDWLSGTHWLTAKGSLFCLACSIIAYELAHPLVVRVNGIELRTQTIFSRLKLDGPRITTPKQHSRPAGETSALRV